MTALTHFSTRFQKDDETFLSINPNNYQSSKRKYATANTFMVFDHLEVRMKELEKMPEISKKIDKVFFPIRRTEITDE